jgi:hypothetical protein
MTGVGRAALGVAVIMSLVLPECAGAVELTGAWASYADKCDKVFVRRGRAKQIDFAEFPGGYGGGFIIEAGQLRSKFAKCKIKNRKRRGWEPQPDCGLRDGHHAVQRLVCAESRR